jgi:DNA-3-methyladenine glycosylase
MEPRPLPLAFYARDTVLVAQEVLGKILVRELTEAMLQGRIVEAEAYRGTDDPASHSYRGMTKRNQVMFGRPGHAYVYFTYGNHYCLNVVTERDGVPGAVLVRALEPLKGLDAMKRSRGTDDVRNLTSGPGKLTKALAITGAQNGLDLTAGRGLFLTEPDAPRGFETAQSRRIGIREGSDKLWRFSIKGNLFVSKKAAP